MRVSTLAVLLLCLPFAAAQDLTGDGRVDLQDLLLVTASYGRSAGFDARADTNSDGRVDLFDLVAVARRFGHSGLLPGGALFSDGFETYAIGSVPTGTGDSGFVWGAPNTGSEDWVEVSAAYAFSGNQSLHFRYGGNPDPADDAFAEIRFSLPQRDEYWVEWWMRIPENYAHRNPGPSNNKLMRIWSPEPPGNDVAGGASLYPYEASPGWDAISNGVLQWGDHNDYMDQYRGYESEFPLVSANGTNGAIIPGEWGRMRFHYRLSSGEGVDDGRIAIWVNDLRRSLENITWRAADGAGFTGGYLLGWANTGFDEDTDIYVDDVTFYDQDPGWDIPPAAYEEDFETYTDGASITGAGDGTFAWGTGPGASVSTDIAYSGSRSLRFDFVGNNWAEQRFSLGRHVDELWIHFKMYFPDGTEGLGVSAWDVPDYWINSKFFRLWGGDLDADPQDSYGSPNKMGATIFSEGDGINAILEAMYGPTSGGTTGTGVNTPFLPDVQGRWVDVKMHYRYLSAQGASDAAAQIWLDDVLVVDAQNIPQAWDASHPHWNFGYLLGDANYDAPNTHVYLDDIRFHLTDPGWG